MTHKKVLENVRAYRLEYYRYKSAPYLFLTTSTLIRRGDTFVFFTQSEGEAAYKVVAVKEIKRDSKWAYSCEKSDYEVEYEIEAIKVLT